MSLSAAIIIYALGGLCAEVVVLTRAAIHGDEKLSTHMVTAAVFWPFLVLAVIGSAVNYALADTFEWFFRL